MASPSRILLKVLCLVSLDEKSLSFLKRIGTYEKRVLAGFVVATNEQVKRTAPHVHAVVGGTALIRCIKEAANAPLYPRLKAKLEELAGK